MSEREGWLDDYAASVEAMPAPTPSWDFSDPIVREAILDVALGRTPPARLPSLETRSEGSGYETTRHHVPNVPDPTDDTLGALLRQAVPERHFETHDKARARRQQDKMAVTKGFRRSVDASFQKRADRMEACGKTWRWLVNLEHPELSGPRRIYCGDRMCPYCAVIRQKQLVKQFTPLIAAARAKGQIIRAAVFTRRDVTDEAPEIAVEKMFADWAKFIRTNKCKRHFKAWIRAFEMTRNAKKKTWHPHFHVVAVGSFWPVKDLEATWRKIQKDPTANPVWIKKDTRPLDELLGYPLKPGTLFDKHGRQVVDGDMIVRLARALARRRLVAVGGDWKGLLDKKPKDENVLPVPLWMAREHARSGDPTAPLLIRGLDAWGERHFKGHDLAVWRRSYAGGATTVDAPDPHGRTPAARLRDALRARLRAQFSDEDWSANPYERGG